MSRMPIPFAIADSSAFARSLRAQLGKLGHQPSHVELLNIVARAGGHRNFQHLRAAALAGGGSAKRGQAPVAAGKVARVLGHFDEVGRMIRWPSRTNHQLLCLWGVWAHIPGGARFSEAEINDFINSAHTFGDFAILRRSLVNEGMLARTPDGRIYRRLDPVPSPEAAAVLEEVRRRAKR